MQILDGLHCSLTDKVTVMESLRYWHQVYIDWPRAKCRDRDSQHDACCDWSIVPMCRDRDSQHDAGFDRSIASVPCPCRYFSHLSQIYLKLMDSMKLGKELGGLYSSTMTKSFQ